jgi:hypothetical protein
LSHVWYFPVVAHTPCKCILNVYVISSKVFLKVAEEKEVDEDDETKRNKLEEGTDGM